jgi:hypothetical protein
MAKKIKIKEEEVNISKINEDGSVEIDLELKELKMDSSTFTSAYHKAFDNKKLKLKANVKLFLEIEEPEPEEGDNNDS